MKRGYCKNLATLLFASASVFVAAGFASGQSFTYQGKLTVNGMPANGSYDLRFRLFDSSAGGTQQGGNSTADDVSVTGGIFTVELEFGPGAIAPGLRWIEMEVRPGASTDAYHLLGPRQKITEAPYSTLAIRSMSSEFADASNDSNTVGGISPLLFIQEGDARLSDARPPLPGASNYVQTSPATPQSGSFDVLGNGKVGSSFSVLGATFLNSSLSVGGLITGNGSGLTNVPGTIAWQFVSGTSQQAQVNKGYLLDNTAQVAVTLPTSPIAGDIVRVSGMGSGGWKITQNAGQIIQGVTAIISGAVWTPRDSTRTWQAVASSADGTKLAAVVFFGSIYTSTDSGATWTPRANSQNWSSIASSSDGVKLVAAINGGSIHTSIDSGVTWVPRPFNGPVVSVASSADGTKLVLAAGNGGIHTSNDSGATWTLREGTRFWSQVASSSDGTKLVATARDASAQWHIFTSVDSGVTWLDRISIPQAWAAVASSSDGTKLIAAIFNNGQIYTSSDSGVTWTPRENSRNWRSVASSADGTKLVAVADNSQIYWSATSGLIWVPSDNARAWQSVASAADGSKLVALEVNGRAYTSTPSATPVTSTTLGTGFIVGGQYTSIELQYIGGGRFIPLSHEGTIQGF